MAEGAPVSARPLTLDELAESLKGVSPGRALPVICFSAAAGEPPVEA